jgi:hypothetical protein
MKTQATRISALALAVVLAAPLVSCGGGGGLPPFQGGIEIITAIVDSVTHVSTPQMGVQVMGQFASADGGSCSPNGTQLSFSGVTNGNGDYRCPQCEVNAMWNLTINYNTVTGGCTPNLQQFPVNFPCGGAQQPTQCIL